MTQVVNFKTVVEVLCDPDKYTVCDKISGLPDNVSSDHIPIYWGILGLSMMVISTSILGSNSLTISFDIRDIGWEIMMWLSYTLWLPVVILWLLRIILNDNETVNWLFVLFSNLTMIGPILGYWVSLILIVVGWAVDSFSLVDMAAVINFIIWLFTAFVASWY